MVIEDIQMSNIKEKAILEDPKKKDFSEASEKEDKEIKITRSKRCFLYLLFIFITLVVNMDHGVIPAATDVLGKDYDLSPFQIGLLGTFVYIGNFLGIFKYKK
jgi:hypothetical protein